MKNSFYQVGGTLPANAPTYIKREADTELYNYLKEKKYCYVLNARQVGKSSLLVQVSNRLSKENYKCVNIDITSIGIIDITAKEWYFTFVFMILEQLHLDIDEFYDLWDSLEKLTIIKRFSKIIDKILKQTQDEIIIFLDEIDSVLDNNVFSTDDFFAVIRTFYNLRSENNNYNRLTFAIFGVATPEDLMRDSSRTPFNIAHSIHLSQLSFEESMPLVKGLDNQTINPQEILKKVFAYTSGTPYLTQKILDYIYNHPINVLEDIDRIIDTLFIEKGFEETNIRHIQTRILNNTNYNVKMLYLIHKIINYQIVSNDSDLDQIYLKLSGLVKKQDTLLVYSNKIYTLIFTQKWLEDMLLTLDRPFSKDLNRWLALNKDSSALLRGEVLKEAIDWANTREDLTHDENSFLRESMHQERTITLQGIDEKLNQLSNQLKEDKNYEHFTIPLSLDKKIEISEALLQKYEFTDKNIIQENSAIIQILLNLKNEFVYREKRAWLYDLASMNLEQKKKFFTIIQNKALKNMMDGANNFRNKEEYDKAIPFYLEFIKIDPNSYDAYNQIGIAYYMTKEYDKSMEAYNKAIKINPKSSNTYMNIGLVYTQQKEYDNAIPAYHKAIEMNPKNDKAYNDLGSVYYIKKKYDQAKEAFTKAIEINPNNSEANENLERIHKERYEYQDKRIEVMQEHIQLGLNPAEAYNKMGIAYYEKKEYDKAIEAYQKAVAINPQKDQAYYNMGIAYGHKKEYDKAIEAYQKAVAINPQNDDAYNNMGSDYYHKKEYDKAIEAYQKAVAINPQKDEAYYNMGSAYYHKKEYDKAIECYQKAIDINPSEDTAYLNMLETQLSEEKVFDKTVEEKYMALFKDKKESFIIYDMLKILSQINQNQQVDINAWLEKYHNQNLDRCNFDHLEEWMENKDSGIKEKLLEALKVFKSKQDKNSINLYNKTDFK